MRPGLFKCAGSIRYFSTQELLEPDMREGCVQSAISKNAIVDYSVELCVRL